MKRRTISVSTATQLARREGVKVSPRHMRRIIVAKQYLPNGIKSTQICPGGNHRLDAESFHNWLNSAKKELN